MIACEFCDLLHRQPALVAGEKAYCPRCGGLVARVSRSPIERTLALTLAALMLLVLANLLPFLRFSLEGNVQENRIITGVIGLWAAGQPGLASLILFTTVLAPALRIAGLLYVLVPLAASRVPPAVASAVRFQEGLGAWAMLDVYMLAVLVAYVKLAQMADVQLELGAFCFLALFGVLTLMGVTHDREAVWDRVEALQ